MKSILLFIIFIFPIVAQGQGFGDELRHLGNLSRLPSYREGNVEQLSSYDRTGGNDDGFSGTHSYLSREGDISVIADLKGPGVINRIWTPTPSRDSIYFYFDGEKQPRIACPFVDLFSGEYFPFVAPLCGTEIGGYYCYLPIPYKQSLKIIYKGDELKFHQFQYRQYPAKSKIESYSDELVASYKSEILQLWQSVQSTTAQREKVSVTLSPGEYTSIFKLEQGGRIVALELEDNTPLAGKSRDVIFSAYWDNQQQPAFNLPMADFFGFAYGNAAMNGLLCGSIGKRSYSHFPMPFDRVGQLDVALASEATAPVQLNFIIDYELTPRDPLSEGYFYATWNRESPANGKPYIIADISGRGHYVGTSLIAQGLEGGMTLFWEGDDCSMVDGRMTMHGTGSEDYFNGGWYAVIDRWDRGVSTPLHGALDYELKSCRTGGYRFMLSDKITFDKSYELTMEHGPEKNCFNVDYTSVGYFYADKPKFANSALTVDNRKNPKLDQHIVLAQDFTTRLYWYSTLYLTDSYAQIEGRPDTHWALGIDFEAVPMVQFDLGEHAIPEGLYKLSVNYIPWDSGGDFVVWQRTRQIGEWISTCEGSGESQMLAIEVGEIELSDQCRTITLRRPKEKTTAIRVHSFVLQPINK